MHQDDTPAAGRPEKLAALRAHFDKWYADFDWQAMEVALCAILAHYAARDTQPIWPFIVGAPRTGKTEVIRALEGLPKAESIGDLTPTSLMSGHKDAKGGLLNQLQEEGKSILLFKDFTTILSKHQETRDEVISILREVADGDFNRWTGLGKVPPWKGRITIVAAVTPAIEKAWSVMQSLGPRFLFIRWPSPNPLQAAQMARSQVNQEKGIHLTSQRLVREIFYDSGDLYLATENEAHNGDIDMLAWLFTLLRRHVRWNYRHTEIEEVDGPEGTGSIAKHLSLIARTRASLYNRPTVGVEDLVLARRVALDSCPVERAAIVRYLAAVGQNGASIVDMAAALGMERKTIKRRCTELEALMIAEVIASEGMPDEVTLCGSFYDNFRHLLV